uniref:Rhodanese domain-containing protein n=1 Tax=Eutreptiella gymnastica TaxID=73025 RepID=A0A7S1J4S7_9EUGL|mmetsp:Transcript_66796/g.118523  ORF Transcript_66796/g.118523 Transcript_66796/m.118523 type:complete len:368 (+) Transcript_66796:63-1166(+)
MAMETCKPQSKCVTKLDVFEAPYSNMMSTRHFVTLLPAAPAQCDVIDVRDNEQIVGGHFKGSQHSPLADLHHLLNIPSFVSCFCMKPHLVFVDIDGHGPSVAAATAFEAARRTHMPESKTEISILEGGFSGFVREFVDLDLGGVVEGFDPDLWDNVSIGYSQSPGTTREALSPATTCLGTPHVAREASSRGTNCLGTPHLPNAETDVYAPIDMWVPTYPREVVQSPSSATQSPHKMLHASIFQLPRAEIEAEQHAARIRVAMAQETERTLIRELELFMKPKVRARMRERECFEAKAIEAELQRKDCRISCTFERRCAETPGTMRLFGDDGAEEWHIRLRREEVEQQEAELAALEDRVAKLETGHSRP